MWPIGLPFWAAFLWTAAGELPMLLRSRATPPAATDRGSRIAVEAATVLGAVFAFGAAGWLRQFAITTFRFPVYLAGVACLLAAGALRRHCFRILGPSFTFDVRVTADRQVIDRGAYKYVRHPSYTAGLLAFAGIGLGLGNWLSLLAPVAMLAAAYVYRIRVEEAALTSVLGDRYTAYMQRTHRLIPFLL